MPPCHFCSVSTDKKPQLLSAKSFMNRSICCRASSQRSFLMTVANGLSSSGKVKSRLYSGLFNRAATMFGSSPRPSRRSFKTVGSSMVRNKTTTSFGSSRTYVIAPLVSKTMLRKGCLAQFFSSDSCDDPYS